MTSKRNIVAVVFFGFASAACASTIAELGELLPGGKERVTTPTPTSTPDPSQIPREVGRGQGKVVFSTTTPYPTPTPTPTQEWLEESPYPTQTPRGTGYVPDGVPSIKVMTAATNTEGVQSLSVAFTAGLGSPAVLDFIRAEHGQPGLDFWLPSGVGPKRKFSIYGTVIRAEPGAPIHGGLHAVVHDNGESYLLVTQDKGSRYWLYRDEYQYDSESVLYHGKAGFTFRWDPLGKSWTSLSLQAFRRETFSQGNAIANWKDAWDDIQTKFLKPLTGREDFGYKILDGSVPGKITMLTPTGTESVDIGDLERKVLCPYDSPNTVLGCMARQWLSVGVPDFDMGHLLKTKRGWVFMTGGFGSRSATFFVQKSGETAWTKKVELSSYSALLSYMEWIPGGPLSPFEERGRVVLSGENIDPVLLDEEILFK